jgi:hypothetical protein
MKLFRSISKLASPLFVFHFTLQSRHPYHVNVRPSCRSARMVAHGFAPSVISISGMGNAASGSMFSPASAEATGVLHNSDRSRATYNRQFGRCAYEDLVVKFMIRQEKAGASPTPQ